MSAEQPLINLEFALSQLSGNSDLLFRMLHKFKTEFSKVPTQVRKLVDNSDLKEAKLKVHTTKGLSGNLGLMALYESAKKLDQSLRAGLVDHELIDKFDLIVQQTCDEIDRAELDAPVGTSFTDKTPQEDLKSLFIEQLKRNEFIDDETLHKYIDALSMSSEQKQQLQAMVEDLEYDSAVTFIKQNA